MAGRGIQTVSLAPIALLTEMGTSCTTALGVHVGLKRIVSAQRAAEGQSGLEEAGA